MENSSTIDVLDSSGSLDVQDIPNNQPEVSKGNTIIIVVYSLLTRILFYYTLKGVLLDDVLTPKNNESDSVLEGIFCKYFCIFFSLF